MGLDEVLAEKTCRLAVYNESHDCSVSLIEMVGLGSIVGTDAELMVMKLLEVRHGPAVLTHTAEHVWPHSFPSQGMKVDVGWPPRSLQAATGCWKWVAALPCKQVQKKMHLPCCSADERPT